MRYRLLIAAAVLLAAFVGTIFLTNPPGGNDPPDRAPSGSETGSPGDALPAVRKDATVARETEPGADGNAELLITGEVAGGPDGEPIQGARVVVYSRDHLFRGLPWLRAIEDENDVRLLDTEPPGRPVATVESDAEGLVKIRVPRPGIYTVIAGKAPFGDDSEVVSTGDHVQFYLDALVERRVRVVDPEGAPVIGAEVLVFTRDLGGAPPRMRAITDGNGEVLLRFGIETSALLIRRAGFATRRMVEYDLVGDDPVVLERGCPLAGTVRDRKGRPVDGAAVLLAPYMAELRITGADGAFSFDDACVSLYEGAAALVNSCDSDVYLGVYHPDFEKVEIWEIVSPRHMEIVLYRKGAATVSGRILPVPGTEPTLRVRTVSGMRGEEVSLRKDGTFTVSGLCPGPVRLFVICMRSTPTHGPGSESYSSHYGEATVTVPAGGHVESVVIAPERQDVSFVAPRAVDPEGRQIKGVEFVTEQNGSSVAGRWFALDVPPGTEVVFKTRLTGGWEDYALPEKVTLVTSAESSVPPTEIVAEKLPLFTFEFVDGSGSSVPGQGADLHMAQGNRTWTGAAVGNGPTRFTSPLDPERGYLLRGFAAGFGAVLERRGPPDPGVRKLKVVFEPESTVRGRLVTSGGRPVRRVWLNFTLLPPGQRPIFALSHEELDDEGRFVVGGLPAGQMRIAARVPWELGEGVVAETTVEVPRGGVADVGTLTMGSLPTVRGFVTDSEGRPIPGVAVVFQDDSGDWCEVETLTSGDGSFRLSVPRRPKADLEFYAEGFAFRRLPFSPEFFKNPVTVCLTPSDE